MSISIRVVDPVPTLENQHGSVFDLMKFTYNVIFNIIEILVLYYNFGKKKYC